MLFHTCTLNGTALTPTTPHSPSHPRPHTFCHTQLFCKYYMKFTDMSPDEVEAATCRCERGLGLEGVVWQGRRVALNQPACVDSVGAWADCRSALLLALGTRWVS